MTMTHRHATRRTRVGRLVTAAVALGAVSAGEMSAVAASAATKPVVISTMTIGKSGKVLVSKGLPLYTVSNGTTCDAQCLQTWPAVTLPSQVKTATVGRGVQRSKLGVTSGPGGLRQVTYNGRALYWFSQDTAGGGVMGNVTDQWGKWRVVSVAKAGQSSAGTPSNSNSGSNSGGSTAGSGGVSF